MADHKPGHGHAGHMPSSGWGMAISAWLNGIYFIIEMGIGLWTGSIAVISDAFHTFSEVGGILVAIIAARIARHACDPDTADKARGHPHANPGAASSRTSVSSSLKPQLYPAQVSAYPSGQPLYRPRHCVQVCPVTSPVGHWR